MRRRCNCLVKLACRTRFKSLWRRTTPMLLVSTCFLFDSPRQSGIDYVQACRNHPTGTYEGCPEEWRSARGDLGRCGEYWVSDEKRNSHRSPSLNGYARNAKSNMQRNKDRGGRVVRRFVGVLLRHSSLEY